MASRSASIRRTKAYREWHDNAIAATQGICDVCGKIDKPQVHHLNSMSYFPEQATDPKNAVVLCKKCHFSMLHILYKGGTRKKTTKKDYRRFKAMAKFYMKKGGGTL